MRTKLVVLVGVPAVALAALTVLQARSQLQGHAELVTARHDLAISAGAVGVADALHHERDAVISVLGQNRQDFGPLLQSIGRTDEAISSLRAATTDRDTLTPPVRTAVARALVELDGLTTLRQTIRQTRYPDSAALARYSQILGRLTHVGQTVVENTSTLPFAATVATAQALAVATDQLTLQNSIVLASAYHRDLLPEQATDLRAAQARLDAAVATATGQADPRARQLYLDTVSGAEVDERSRLVQRTLIESANAERITAAPEDITRCGDATAERIRTVRRTLSVQASSDVDTAIAQAWRGAMAAIVVALAMLVVTFGAALLMSLSLSRPLRVLRRTALRVADRGLPEAVERILADPNPQRAAQNAIAPVPITTDEEVGQVARAFDAVHGEAVRLATQQALLRDNVNAMFVNLSRRSQALVERQLTLIDRLEQDEQDPDQLASLFELDHLATRMRRNSENLLVLSGTD
ncbi:MAG: nitrate- and nitrite sensing domain-containing protein, partial [Umezawaea sp.]